MEVPTEKELDASEILANVNCNMTIDDVEAIRTAKENNDEDLLSYYKNKTEIYSKALTPNYPVRPEVAKLLAQNPNIIEEIKVKYANIDKLEEERANLNDTSIRVLDPMTGLETEDSGRLSKVNENITKEIQSQRADRKEYLQTLIREAALAQ